jgi:SNF2 family DNA or RNA helicase
VYTKPDKDNARQVVALDNEPRIDALLDILSGCERKVLVFVPFTHALNAVAKKLSDEGYDTAVVDGSTTQRARGEIFVAFQQTSKYRVLVAHPGTMAHGVTLTAADTIIWFGPTTSYETFEQANGRITRIGQKHKQQVIMMQSTAAERKIYATLRDRKKVQDTILDMFAEATT